MLIETILPINSLLYMNQINFTFAETAINISYPEILENIVRQIFNKVQADDKHDTVVNIHINHDRQESCFWFASDHREDKELVPERNIAVGLSTYITEEIIANLKNGPVIHSAVLSHKGSNIIVPGVNECKNTLTAWLMAQDYQYQTDELCYITNKQFTSRFFHKPFKVSLSNLPIITDEFGKIIKGILPGNKNALIILEDFLTGSTDNNQPPSLFLFSSFRRGQPLSINVVPPAKTAMRLVNHIVNGRNLRGHGIKEISSLSKKIPALEICYESVEQLENLNKQLIPTILENRLSHSTLQVLLSPYDKKYHILQPAPAPQTTQLPTISEEPKPIPEPTPIGPKKKLTIGMATYDDYDGVYFTVQAIRLFHPEITEISEILVIDNHPGGQCGQALKKLEVNVKGYRYIPVKDQSGTAVRDHIFYNANGDYVLSMDCHVLVVPGALKKLIDYLDQHPSNHDLLQGPILSDDLSTLMTHFAPVWRKGMYGIWEYDEKAANESAPPFEIPMQGLGLFACKKEDWPGFNPRFRGFGGEEGYIHEKFRLRGGKTLCLPFLRWVHRFGRPMGIPYPVNWKDRVFNYMTGFKELGLDCAPIKSHFEDHLGKEPAQNLMQEVVEELNSPFSYFDAIYCISLDTNTDRWRKMKRRFETLGIMHRVRIFKAIDTPEDHHIGCTLSHRAIVETAKNQKLRNVLVFEDDALFLDTTMSCLSLSLKELKKQDWNAFYLGGYNWGKTFKKAEGCSHLEIPVGLTTAHAIAYNNTIYERMLHDIPASIEQSKPWMAKHKAIDQYLRGFNKLYLASPPVATQVQLLPQEESQYRNRFTLGDTEV